MARTSSASPARGGRLPAAKRGKRPAFQLDRHIFYYFSRILASRNRALNAKLAVHGLDYPRWRILGVLSEHPGAAMLELAELTSVDRTTLTHTVRMMVDEGLIERRARGSDRRSVELELTRRGRAMFKRILPAVLTQNDQALSGLPSREIDALRASLRHILRNLKD